MTSPINIPAILIANGMGLAILYVVAVGNLWRRKDNSGDTKCLFIIFLSSIMNCIVDPICFLADGKPGLFNRILVVGCNTLLYFGGIVIAYTWIYLIASHLKTKLHKVHRKCLLIAFAVVVSLLIVNLFTPVLFTVDESNVYSRLGGYWVHMAFYVLFMLDGLVTYFRRSRASGGLKFFPVWAFIIPAVIGISVQTAFYGLSTATPFTTVSVVCVILCLQNEVMLRDKLTGLYNRFYLNEVEKKLLRNPKLEYTAIMLDINGFKQINDTYGHKVGDEALIRLASILSGVVGKIGEVVRYAGDEFIVILNTQDDERTAKIIARIHDSLERFNRSGKAPYTLSAATGCCKLNLAEDTMDAFVDRIDKLMYENKQEYYRLNPQCERRKG